MITMKMAIHVGKWGIPGNRTNNVAQWFFSPLSIQFCTNVHHSDSRYTAPIQVLCSGSRNIWLSSTIHKDNTVFELYCCQANLSLAQYTWHKITHIHRTVWCLYNIVLQCLMIILYIFLLSPKRSQISHLVQFGKLHLFCAVQFHKNYCCVWAVTMVARNNSHTLYCSNHTEVNLVQTSVGIKVSLIPYQTPLQYDVNVLQCTLQCDLPQQVTLQCGRPCQITKLLNRLLSSYKGGVPKKYSQTSDNVWSSETPPPCVNFRFFLDHFKLSK
jgi:hypothetical protein